LARGVFQFSASRTNSVSFPCSHSVCTGSTEFSMICSQLQLTTFQPQIWIVLSPARPSQRGNSGAGCGPK